MPAASPWPLSAPSPAPHRRDALLARALWQTGLHEARILACLVHNPTEATDEKIEAMVRAIDSWNLCDQFTNNLARHLPQARDKARSWLTAEAPFLKRAGLSLVASLAGHDKISPPAVFKADVRAVAAVACDDRQPVKKGVSWALRQIGKRNELLRLQVTDTARALLATGDTRARFAARDVLRELGRPDRPKKLLIKPAC